MDESVFLMCCFRGGGGTVVIGRRALSAYNPSLKPAFMRGVSYSAAEYNGLSLLLLDRHITLHSSRCYKLVVMLGIKLGVKTGVNLEVN